MVEKNLAHKLEIWKRVNKVKVRQGDGNFVVNTTFKIMDSSSKLSKFPMYAEVLDIGNWDLILGLYWLTEKEFSVDTSECCLRNVNSGQVIPCSVKWIPEVLIMEEEPLEDGRILLIMDTPEQYSCNVQCFSAEQAARLPESKSCNHQIPLQDLNAKIPIEAIYKMTWEEDEAP